MNVFCEHNTPRLNYILSYVFIERLGIDFRLITDFDTFKECESPKLNYSEKVLDDCISIVPKGILFENIVRKTKPVGQIQGDSFIMFPTHGSLSFDIFSAIFWFISRYEEYQDYTPDKFNRFPATESFAYRREILHIPVVDQWVIDFKNVLIKHFPELEFKKEKYELIPTLDIDSPWCYRNKGFIRNLGGLARDYWKANFKEVLLRFNVLFRIKSDPWYQFNWMQKVFKQLNLKPIFFIHVGNYGKYDKTVKHSLAQFKKFVNNLNDLATVGLHPSYEAGKSKPVFEEELMRIKKLTGNETIISRQHYLTIHLPEYYQALESLDIFNDYSMGFADAPGFRAGTSRPFYFYDLANEKATKLLIHPFCIMDRTLKSYKQLSNDKVLSIFNEFALSLKKVNGVYMTLWHNETFSEAFEWKGWKTIFTQAMKKATE